MIFNPFTLNARIKWLESGKAEAEYLVDQLNALDPTSHYSVNNKDRCISEIWPQFDVYKRHTLIEAAKKLTEIKVRKFDACSSTKKGKCK